MSDLDPKEVIATFSRLTGIHFKVLCNGVTYQAMKFVKSGFTLQELELVILWTKRQISRGEGGYSASSLQWRVLFGDYGSGDEMLKFQERLGLAEECVRKGWRPPIAGMAVRPVAKPTAPVQERFSEEEGKRAAAELREFAAKLKGGQG